MSHHGRRVVSGVLVACALLAAGGERARAADTLPLPDAPVRLFIPDVAAFDTALGGSFRAALSGSLGDDDPAFAAWRQTLVGTKLTVQWQRLAGDLPWSWKEIVAIQARSVAVAMLDVGHLESVVAIRTPLAKLPAALPAGAAKNHAGVAYHLVAAGAGDAGVVGAGSGASTEQGERRAGLAWARVGDVLLLATSERALLLALDQSASGLGVAAPLEGLASLELDLDRLRADRYFKREFLFDPEFKAGPEAGRLRAALRRDGNTWVEFREGAHEPRGPGFELDAPKSAASGWEADGTTFWSALRAGILEPLPTLVDRPHIVVGSLPAVGSTVDDRYLVSLARPLTKAGTSATDEGELAEWSKLLAAHPVSGWGFVIDPDGTRKLVFPWPAERDDELLRLCRATLERRAGRVEVASVGDTRELRVGPDLPALAIRRTGDLVWIGPSAQSLADAVAPRKSAERVRWARVDLDAVRTEAPRWARAEGPASPERVRALSDRILGLLQWIPEVGSVSVERHITATGWAETVTFSPRAAP